MTRSWTLCVATLSVLLPAHDARAGWATLSFPAPVREGDALVFRGEQGIAAVSVLAQEVVRVRFSPTPSLGRDHSYAVVSRELGERSFSVRTEGGRTIVATRALSLTLSHAPFRVAVASASGESLDEDDAELATAVNGRRFKVWKRLREDEHVYGLGEKVGKLDKRGWQLGGYSYAMWNSDTFGYDSSTAA